MIPKLFNVQEKEPRIEKVLIADIIIPDFDPPGYMTNSTEGFGVIDEVKLVEKGKKYEIVDGRRRLATLKAAGAEYVNAKIFEKLRDYERAMITLISNYCRSHNVISELEALQILQDKGMEQDQIRMYLNVSKNKIAQLYRLKDLPEALYTALAQNKITESIAKAIAGMSKKNQKKLAKIFLETGTVTGSDIRALKNETKEQLAENMDDQLFYNPCICS